jgi:hypothetical protein
MGKIKKNGPKKRGATTPASSRLDAVRADTERLVLSMQFFCLDPRLELYNEIINSATIRNQQADFIGLWKSAAVATYGDMWGMLNDDIQTAQRENSDTVSKLSNTKVPTSETADKLWYIFFATGKVEDLENIWALSGARMIEPHVANIMTDRYVTFKDAYTQKVADATIKNDKYFSDHPMSPFPLLASGAFNEMQRRIDKMTDDIDDAGDIDTLIQRVNGLVSNVSNVSNDMGSSKVSDELDHLQDSIEDTEEIKTKKEKLKWLVDQYDKIEKRVAPKNIINKRL